MSRLIISPILYVHKIRIKKVSLSIFLYYKSYSRFPGSQQCTERALHGSTSAVGGSLALSWKSSKRFWDSFRLLLTTQIREKTSELFPLTIFLYLFKLSASGTKIKYLLPEIGQKSNAIFGISGRKTPDSLLDFVSLFQFCPFQL